MLLLILCSTNPIDTLLRTIFHISEISLKLFITLFAKNNQIKGKISHNSAQSSLDNPTE